jgi:hypothetical protein
MTSADASTRSSGRTRGSTAKFEHWRGSWLSLSGALSGMPFGGIRQQVKPSQPLEAVLDLGDDLCRGHVVVAAHRCRLSCLMPVVGASNGTDNSPHHDRGV